MYRLQISEELKSFMQEGRKQKLPKGHVIQSTDNSRAFYYITSGFVKRYLISNNGSLGVQVIYGPGDVFPITLAYNVLFDQQTSESPEVYYYETMTPAIIHSTDKDRFKDYVQQNPALYRGLLAISGKRLHSTLHGLENLTLADSYHRLAHELLYMGQRFGERQGESMKIMLPLTHQDLADILSLTRETVSTNMILLRKNKLIKTGKNIVIPNLDKLALEAYN